MVNLTKGFCFTSDDVDDNKDDDDEGADGKKGLALTSNVLGINNQQILFFRAIAFFLAFSLGISVHRICIILFNGGLFSNYSKIQFQGRTSNFRFKQKPVPDIST